MWEDSLRLGDPELAAGMPERVEGLELICRRLTPVMGLDKLPKKELSEEKKQALRKMRAGEPPSQSELAAMKKRKAAMKKAGAAARVMIYPARVGGKAMRPLQDIPRRDARRGVHRSTLRSESWSAAWRARTCSGARRASMGNSSSWDSMLQRAPWRSTCRGVRSHPPRPGGRS